MFDRENPLIELQSKYILLVEGGALQIGSEEEPYDSKAIITMHGNVRCTEMPIFGSKNIEEDSEIPNIVSSQTIEHVNECLAPEAVTEEIVADITASSVSHIDVSSFEAGELCDSCPSMTSHFIPELSELPCPSDSATSMASHMAEDVMQEADDAQLDISYEIYDTLMHLGIFEDEANISFCAHQLQCPDSPLEHTDFISSNVSHCVSVLDSENADFVDYGSLLAHQLLDIGSEIIPDYEYFDEIIGYIEEDRKLFMIPLFETFGILLLERNHEGCTYSAFGSVVGCYPSSDGVVRTYSVLLDNHITRRVNSSWIRALVNGE